MDFRFAAHDPRTGEFLRIMPRPVSVQIGDTFGTRGTLVLSYAGSPEIETFLEVRAQVSFGGEWEQVGPALLRLGGSHEDTDASGMRTVEFVSREWVLGKARVGEGELPLVDGKRPFYQASPGEIMRSLLLEAQDRGAAQGIELGPFDAATDSAGTAWSKVATIYYSPGLPIASVLENLVDQGMCDYRMNGRTLELFEPDTAMGRDLTVGDPVRIHGAVTEAPVAYTLEDLTTSALLIGEEGFQVEVANPSAPRDYGELEVTIEQGGVNSEATARTMIDAELQRGSREIREITRSQAAAHARYLPFRDYRVGDYVEALDNGRWERYRVREVQIVRDGDGWTVHTVLNDRLQELLLKLAKRTSGIVNGSKGSGGDGTPPAPAPRPGLEPAAPQGLVVDQQVYIDGAGDARGIVTAGWGAVTESTRGQRIDLAGYELWRRDNETHAPWRMVARTDGDTGATDAPVWLTRSDGSAAQYQWRVRAVAQQSGREGAWSEPVTLTMTQDTTPPPLPSAPVVSTGFRIVSAEWDGLTADGTEMPSDFARVRVYTGTTESMSDARQVGSILYPGTWNSETMPAGVQVWVAFTAVDRVGNESAMTAAVPVTPQALVDEESISAQVEQIGEDIAAAASEAAQDLDVLDGKLTTAQQELATVGENVGQLETDLAAESDAREQLASDVQGTFSELDTRLDSFGDDEALSGLRAELQAARDTADSASAAASAADQAASAASQAALEAAGIAASKGRVIIQSAEPTGEDRNAANIWIKPVDDDPETEVEERAVTYVYLEQSDEWIPTTSDELAQAAQNALDAREAAQQAQQRAETAISNAATAHAAAEAAQRTADDATLDAREAHNEAVEAARRIEEARGSLVNLTPWGGMENPRVGGDPQAPAGWNQHYDPEGAAPGFNAYVETVVDDGQAANVGMNELGDSPVRPGHTYRLTFWVWTNAVSDNLGIGYFPIWRMPDGSSLNTEWGSGFRPSGRSGASGNVTADPFVSGQWRKVVEDFTPPSRDGVTAIGWIPRMHRWEAGSTSHGADGSAAVGDIWRFTGIRLEDVTDLLAAEAAAKEAKDRADEAYSEAASKATPAEVQAAADAAEDAAKQAASLDATAKAAQAKADALSGAAVTAQEKADAAKAQAVADAAADASAKANQALQDALAALATARGEITAEIRASANGKNSITISTSNPSGSGVVAGDTWWRVDSSGQIFGQWRWTGNSWTPATIRSEVIANLDVHKLIGTSGEFEMFFAENFTANDAVVEKLWADQLAAKAIATTRLAVAPGNLLPDPYFSEPEMWNGAGREVVVDTAVPGGSAFELTRSSSLTGSYYGGLGHKVLSIEGGAKYRLRVMARFEDDSIPQLLVYFRMSRRGQGDASYAVRLDRTAAATGQYAYLETEWHANNDIEGMGTVGFFIPGGSGSAKVRVAAPELVRKAGAVLIEDGAVGADQIRADEVGAEVGRFVEAEVGRLKATTGTVGSAVIEKLWADGLVAKTGTFGRLTVGNENLAPPILPGSDQWDMNGGRALIYSLPGRSSTDYALRLEPHDGDASIYGPMFDVEPGDEYRFTWKGGRSGSEASAGRWYMGLRTYDENGGLVTYGPYADNGVNGFNWDTEFDGTVTVPTGARQARIVFLILSVTNPGTSSHTTIYDLRAVKKAGAVHIADGAVTADKVRANAITAGKIAANAITAGKIAANAVRADEIAAGAIDGKIITGATVRTAASGARVQLNTNGLYAYNASGSLTSSISAQTGAVDLTGNITQRNSYGSAIFGPQPYSSSTASPGLSFNVPGYNWWGPGGLYARDDGSSGFPATRMQGFVNGETDGSSMSLAPGGTTTTASTYFRRGYTSGQMAILSFESNRRVFLESDAANIYVRSRNSNNTATNSGLILYSNGEAELSGLNGNRVRANSSGITMNGVIGRTITGPMSQVVVGNGGIIGVDGSSRRWKTSIEHVDPATYEDGLLEIDYASWLSRDDVRLAAELKAWRAENPMCPTPPEYGYVDEEPIRQYGVIAEEAHATGVPGLVGYGEDGEPETVNRANFGIALIPIVKRLRDRVAELEARIGELDG